MFDFWSKEAVYGVCWYGQLTDNMPSARLVVNSEWGNPIPVFLYLHDMVPSDMLHVSYVHIEWEDNCTVFAVVTTAERLQADTETAISGMLNIIHERVGSIGSWMGCVVRDGQSYIISGTGRRLASYLKGTFKLPTFLPLVKHVDGEYVLESKDVYHPIDISDAAFLDYLEFKLALAVACVATEGDVTVSGHGIVETFSVDKILSEVQNGV